MTRDDIVKQLTDMGYDAQAITVSKDNGLQMIGIRVVTSKYKTYASGPVIYVDPMLETLKEKVEAGFDQKMAENDLMNEIVEIIESTRKVYDIVSIVEAMSDPKFVEENLRIGLRSRTEDRTLSRPTCFNNLDQYLFVKFGDNGFVKLNDRMLGVINIPGEKLWQKAKANTFTKDSYTCQTMYDTLVEVLNGIPISEDEKAKAIEEIDAAGGISRIGMVISSSDENKYRGAVQILNPHVMDALTEKTGETEFIMLPSSMNEVIVLPKKNGIEEMLGYLKGLVYEINRENIDPNDWLSDDVFEFHVNDVYRL